MPGVVHVLHGNRTYRAPTCIRHDVPRPAELYVPADTVTASKQYIQMHNVALGTVLCTPFERASTRVFTDPCATGIFLY